ncbi:MAG: N-carbamoyl-D-amino-acid hydrolase [Pseudomonadota bacterium]
MDRRFVVASAQMGPIAKDEPRQSAVARMVEMLREAHAQGARLVVFPELALTTFFPRWMIEDEAELATWFEGGLPGPAAQPLFEVAADLGVGFYLGYAERAEDAGKVRWFNTSILVGPDGTILGKYRKVHLPGHDAPQPGLAFQHLEKLYFEPGNLGFPVFETFAGRVGMLICNDRRWPEAYRVMGLQGVELIALGYNTPVGHTGYADLDGLAHFHNHLSMQAGAYQNASWVVGTAKCGVEEGSMMIGQSAIIAPSGEIVAQARTVEDEVITATVDLDMAQRYRETIFDFARHREPGSYGLITERKGAGDPVTF